MPSRMVLHPNECMVRTGLLVGLASGFAVLGHWPVAGGVGIFAAVQVLNVTLQVVQGRR